MKKWEQNLNKTVNSLTLIGVEKVGSKYLGRYRCVCGNARLVDMHTVNTGKQKSCGCKKGTIISKAKTKHGGSRNKEGKESSEYVAWRAIKDRCYNPKNISYKHYGGKKIKMCARWKNSFTNFLEDMGEKPTPAHSIDRINPNWGYTPSNCRWATREMQAHNQGRRKSRLNVPGVLLGKSGRYTAQIGNDYRKVHLGTFSTLSEASAAYMKAKAEIIATLSEV